MQPYSHSSTDTNGVQTGSKLLVHHLEQVSGIALTNFSARTRFGDDGIYPDFLKTVCWLHDFGKATEWFQKYLLGERIPNAMLKNHASLGAHTAWNLLQKKPKPALLAYFIIRLHHSNLMNFEKVLWPDTYISNKRSIQAIHAQQVQKLMNTGIFTQGLGAETQLDTSFAEPKKLHLAFKQHLKGKTDARDYFLINYLFSLLTEADKLDASDTPVYAQVSIAADSVDLRPGFGKPHYPNKPLSEFSQNELRNYVRAHVVANLSRTDILQKRIFTLAAPTGIGKTMTALDFALKLRSRIETEEGYFCQIIYGLPFINIIEQALREYEQTLPAGQILAHYQYADLFGQSKPDTAKDFDTEKGYHQTKMAWDTWQSDVVITSFVQLFETLIGNRNRLLKKFRHFADAILIIDEVQTLAIEKLPLIGAALYYAAKCLNTRVIIMTATQPKLFELMARELPVHIEEEACQPLNLLENDNAVFACFNRTCIIPHISEKFTTEGFIRFFSETWQPDKSCLIVVNKVSRSIEIFSQLSELLEETGCRLFYLSTNITPYERQQRVLEIKESLKSETCILVSTQVVEAGVDLDFDMGMRDLGPVDSIVQVAGRINRENSRDRLGAPLYVVDLGDCHKIYGSATYYQAQLALGSKPIPESGYKQLVERYFEAVTDTKRADFLFAREIFGAMEQLRYAHPDSGDSPAERTVADFRIIEGAENAVSVFIELPDDYAGSEARNAFQQLLNGSLSRAEFETHHKKTFNQRIVAVPDYLPGIRELNQPENRLTDDILWVQPDVAAFYYNPETGFIRSASDEGLMML
ncbi:MAG: CRISPR-associated helicase Cas3' [Candidatus Cyclonatronum sp.]|uniref:CRISPR-associated helicase Cas3' n=1 Tax=Cyclonatronum sp. TaxID=3024185 RepID=UPI0025BB61F8|nr:CRISPR-associated helicase Cas3' [Cyclonatronum sp.]MCH8487662.1 CRISPR-associated helicase Cas3' [Cyclonatronum sp.]